MRLKTTDPKTNALIHESDSPEPLVPIEFEEMAADRELNFSFVTPAWVDPPFDNDGNPIYPSN